MVTGTGPELLELFLRGQLFLQLAISFLDLLEMEARMDGSESTSVGTQPTSLATDVRCTAITAKGRCRFPRVRIASTGELSCFCGHHLSDARRGGKASDVAWTIE